MKFANLIAQGNSERNYGDDIQMHAIRVLYDYMGIDYNDVVRITVSDLFNYDGDEYLVVPINNPFWGVYPKLSPKILPVYLGISVLNDSAAESLKWKEFEPIGCRDQHTFDLIRARGIQTYLNGCMTLTLPKAKDRSKADKVYIVDVSDELLEKIPEELKESAVYQTQQIWGREVTEEESLAAYEEYQREAKLVITSRLHCAVPCLAFGIPVILAMKEISFRMGWLHKLIPIYDEEHFDEIDWNPQPLEIEDLKEAIRENAAKRVRETWDKYYSQYRISEIYEDKNFKPTLIEGMNEPINYLKSNWVEEDAHKYMLWGVVQTAESLYQYISEHYPNAELVGVIDAYKTLEFHGMTTGKLELLENLSDDVTIFVTAEKASFMALETFKELGIKNYVICWKNRNSKMQEA
ncbi:MAG: polysaccharide pyruvyl transferase family protein [Lachnospiraceae bacterium]|nr:polysaccharide pyruvyl transferase family protein [Lachnospiraceae bacterium]